MAHDLHDLHAQHRQRLRAQYAQGGMQQLDEAQTLELLLFYALPRVDTHPIAWRLLSRFGTLHAVLQASTAQLCTVQGVGPQAATLLQLVGELATTAVPHDRPNAQLLRTVEQVGGYAAQLFAQAQTERLYLLCLDVQDCIVCAQELALGTPDMLHVPLRRLCQAALGGNAASVILLHNHPDGQAVPSEADIAFTRNACLLFFALGIPLRDHVIYANEAIYSFHKAGMLAQLRTAAQDMLALPKG